MFKFLCYLYFQGFLVSICWQRGFMLKHKGCSNWSNIWSNIRAGLNHDVLWELGGWAIFAKNSTNTNTGWFFWLVRPKNECQPLKEFSELVLPKKRLRMKKVKVPELVLLYSRTSSNTLFFLVKIYWGLTLRTFWEEQLVDQCRYFNFSLYLVIFRAEQKKNHPVWSILTSSKSLTLATHLYRCYLYTFKPKLCFSISIFCNFSVVVSAI